MRTNQSAHEADPPLAALALLARLRVSGPRRRRHFPPGLRLGMVPLVGLNTAKTFPGFESEDGNVKVLITELPPAAYGEVVSAFNANPGRHRRRQAGQGRDPAGLAYFTTESGKAGDTPVKRYSMIVPGAGFSGYVAVQIPENATKIYTDEAVRQMFASAVTRKQVSAEEQIALMPFKITDLADFKDIRTLAPGTSIILADGDESTGYESKPFMILGLIGATRSTADDRARFAQEAALQIPGVRESRVTMSGADPHQRPAGFRDPDRRRQRQGQDPRDGGAVDPLQQRRRLAAHHRQRPARPVADRLHPLPRRARRHPAQGLAKAPPSSRGPAHRPDACRPQFAGWAGPPTAGRSPQLPPAAFSGFCSYTSGTRLLLRWIHPEGGERCWIGDKSWQRLGRRHSRRSLQPHSLQPHRSSRMTHPCCS